MRRIEQLPNLKSLFYCRSHWSTPQPLYAVMTALRSLCPRESYYFTDWLSATMHSQLTELDASCTPQMPNNVNGEILSRLTGLRSLVLCNNYEVSLSALSGLTSLTHLNIARTPIGNWGYTPMKRIKSLGHLTSLTSLVLDGTGKKDSRAYTQANVGRYLKSVKHLVIQEMYEPMPPLQFPLYHGQ